jgi:2,3-bisphosphoglycerate-dependent phosphoglycerate mutase
MMLLHLTPDEIMKVEIPTGAPWVFELDDRFSVLKEYYL